MVEFDRIPDRLPAADWVPPTMAPGMMDPMMQGMEEEERRRIRNELQGQSREFVSKLQVWWIDRMCHTQRPLEEKLALFWHGHFATSAEKVRDPRTNFELNQVFRKHGAGNFRTLLMAVGQSPAMMRYLDQDRSTPQKPNENWARECLELFTLGIGHYTEKDIKEAARAFTGWTVSREGQFRFVRRRHDEGEKTFLGRTGAFTGDDIVDIILQQPACAEHVARKLWRYFGSENPPPGVVEGLADTLRRSNYELRPALRQLFLSQAFYDESTIQTQVKSPAQLVVNLLVQLDAPLDERPPVAQLAMRAMGQSLFSPPNVKGWEGGRSWINTNTLLIRYNFSSYLVSGIVPDIGGQRLRGLNQQVRGAVREQESGMTMGETMEGSMQSRMRERDGEGGSTSPAGQDAMPSDVAARTLYEAMLRQRNNRAAARRANPEQAARERQMEAAPFDAQAFFARYEGMKAEEVVDDLANYFLGLPLDPTQKSKILAALMDGGLEAGAPLSIAALPEKNARAAVQLLLSTVEYQVC
jgi:uncharacterized protein (DUF1800 family)